MSPVQGRGSGLSGRSPQRRLPFWAHRGRTRDILSLGCWPAAPLRPQWFPFFVQKGGLPGEVVVFPLLSFCLWKETRALQTGWLPFAAGGKAGVGPFQGSVRGHCTLPFLRGTRIVVIDPCSYDPHTHAEVSPVPGGPHRVSCRWSKRQKVVRLMRGGAEALSSGPTAAFARWGRLGLWGRVWAGRRLRGRGGVLTSMTSSSEPPRTAWVSDETLGAMPRAQLLLNSSRAGRAGHEAEGVCFPRRERRCSGSWRRTSWTWTPRWRNCRCSRRQRTRTTTCTSARGPPRVRPAGRLCGSTEGGPATHASSPARVDPAAWAGRVAHKNPSRFLLGCGRAQTGARQGESRPPRRGRGGRPSR